MTKPGDALFDLMKASGKKDRAMSSLLEANVDRSFVNPDLCTGVDKVPKNMARFGGFVSVTDLSGKESIEAACH